MEPPIKANGIFAMCSEVNRPRLLRPPRPRPKPPRNRPWHQPQHPRRRRQRPRRKQRRQRRHPRRRRSQRSPGNLVKLWGWEACLSNQKWSFNMFYWDFKQQKWWVGNQKIECGYNGDVVVVWSRYNCGDYFRKLECYGPPSNYGSIPATAAPPKWGETLVNMAHLLTGESNDAFFEQTKAM